LVAARDYPVPAARTPSATPATEPRDAPVRFIGTTMQDLLASKCPQLGANQSMVNGFLIHGMLVLERGYIFTCMIIAAISAFLIDRRFFHAAGWSVAAALLTFLGLMHAYQIKGNEVDYFLLFTKPEDGAHAYWAYPVAIGYLLMAALFAAMGALAPKAARQEAGNTLEDARVLSPADMGH